MENIREMHPITIIPDYEYNFSEMELMNPNVKVQSSSVIDSAAPILTDAAIIDSINMIIQINRLAPLLEKQGTPWRALPSILYAATASSAAGIASGCDCGSSLPFSDRLLPRFFMIRAAW